MSVTQPWPQHNWGQCRNVQPAAASADTRPILRTLRGFLRDAAEKCDVEMKVGADLWLVTADPIQAIIPH